MKTCSLFVYACLAFMSQAQAGSEALSSKDLAAAPPCSRWYADQEWNVSVWGAYASTEHDYPTLQNSNRAFEFSITGAKRLDYDHYLEADHAWGGGVDAKFFFARYFGFGFEGYAIRARQSYPDVNVNFFNLGGQNFARTAHDERTIGAVLGSFTLRYPIPGCRLAPYLFAGGGAIFNGGQRSTIIAPADDQVSVRSGSRTSLIGQIGGGLEVRLTPHLGILNDFTWNVVDGSHNNFGLVRSGLNFAF